MSEDLAFQVDWLSSEHGPPELRETSMLLQLTVGDNVATRVEDEWSRSVRSQVRLSAYPLALWFASSWWRLRWEASPEGPRGPQWRMAHEMPAAGHGFLWPPLTFESDTETVDVACRPSPAGTGDPVRYLERFRTSVSSQRFEAAIHNFVELVLARLSAVGIENTELQCLWPEVMGERRDTEASYYRRLEARLGREPDDAPESFVGELLRLAGEVGPDAVEEIAPVCANGDPHAVLEAITAFRQHGGIAARPSFSSEMLGSARRIARTVAPPWQRGWDLAHIARTSWGLGHGPLSDVELAGVLDIPAPALEGQPRVDGLPPMGLGIRRGSQDGFDLLFRKSTRSGRRFEAARFVADHLMAPISDRWLPETDSKTARQKVQRAFAAEFLCPIDALRDFLRGELSDEVLEDAGDYFSVSPLAVRGHLANHGVMPRF